MGCYSGADIVINGLKIYYDAANTKSYAGSGTDVVDLSKNNNGVIENGTTVDSANLGSFAYDGVNDLLRTQNTTTVSATQVSAMVWVKVDAHGNFHNFVQNNWVNSGWIIYGSTTIWGGGIAQNGIQYTRGTLHNNSTDWTHLAFTYDSATVAFYVNGEFISSRSDMPNATLDANYYIYFGNGTRPSPYKIANVLVYDRGLTEAEVVQNYHATKSRYGF